VNAPATGDTITAIATPPGRGGVGIVRLSGPDVATIATALLGALPPPRQAHLSTFRDAEGEALDVGLALHFPAPASFTGEDVLELHGHGGPVVLDRVLTRTLELGARLARPGEFSERAFLNGKLDLAQAEAIADLIESGSEAAARAALRSLQGAFSMRVDALLERLIALRTYVEAAIDFPDEEIDFLSDGHVALGLAELAGEIDAVHAAAERGRRLHDGLSVVIAGPPNAGKSSLLNRFAGQDSAIVTDVPGTTRDLLREYVQLDGLPLHLVDTAGLRDSDDTVEREGIRRAHEVLRAALPDGVPVTVVRNKIDLSGRQAGPEEGERGTEIGLSLRTGDGFEALRDHLKEVSGYSGRESGDFMARRRHLDALTRADAAVARAREQLIENAAGELVAEELRLAQQALGEITGEFTSDDLLGRIFGEFCIGK
jgi:tRNA modification GTPase